MLNFDNRIQNTASVRTTQTASFLVFHAAVKGVARRVRLIHPGATALDSTNYYEIQLKRLRGAVLTDVGEQIDTNVAITVGHQEDIVDFDSTPVTLEAGDSLVLECTEQGAGATLLVGVAVDFEVIGSD